jgi:dephospho-CoA kinase
MQNILPLCVTNGVINIELLRETIFHNEKKMFEVEEFIQPKVFKKFEEIINSNENKNIILVLPTIKNNYFEKKYKVIYITASQENRVKRLSSRENYNIQLIKKIISYQDSVDIYKKNNDFFLDNNGSVKNLENSIRKLVKLL